ncbi:AhpC/TSA family protein [Roseomonas hellenica]|uniref:thioredoxin-dependent peroxiredoxin n=1 Tax=Plastoroseomonas hellenica TaxID=2687306 RepID=A0ABS5EWL4_9PROT|nr:peroxiredoxin-like family protein [Plastoroseomonas hellenica]MBR0664684.1 AhpC/TSA family protein [Plastoroseomonas hellenica]
MGLQEQLAAFRAEFARTAPAGRPALYDSKIEELRTSFALEKAIGTGDEAPDFTLQDGQGRSISLLKELLRGPVVLTFYRGAWCPYCNIQLRAYQAALSEIASLDGSLIAVSPQLPDKSLSTAEMNRLSFHVLSDVGNTVARQFGLVYSLPQELRDALRSNNKALDGFNGDESWELPVPATYVIAPDRRVALTYIDVDYRRRLEPSEVLATLASLRSD